MSGLELAQKVYECFGKGDLPGVLSCLADDVEWELIGPSTIPYFGTYRGREGVQAFFSKLLEVEEILQFVPEQFIDGRDAVAVLGRERCRSKATGKEFSARWVQIFDCVSGKVVRWREYIDTAPMVAAYQD
jgi:uncharacterized protein